MDRLSKLKSVGLLCKKYRKSKNIKQKEIALYLGLSQTRISLFENGQNDSLFIFLAYIELGIITNII